MVCQSYPSNASYVYVLVRKDLTHPQQICQACHACLGVTGGYDCRLVVCKVKSEADLMEWAALLKSKSVSFTKFFEPEPLEDPLGYTALATEPIKGETRNLFKKLRLI